MNLHNALGFAGVGLAMKFLPVLFPSIVGSAPLMDNTRALWLAFMSFVMMGIAGIWFTHKAYLEAKARWTWTPAALATRHARAKARASVQSAAGRAGLSV